MSGDDRKRIVELWGALRGSATASEWESIILAYREEVREQERERCAHICECMVIGGRPWNQEQAICADALFAAAKTIRAAGAHETKEDA